MKILIQSCLSLTTVYKASVFLTGGTDAVASTSLLVFTLMVIGAMMELAILYERIAIPAVDPQAAFPDVEVPDDDDED